MDATRVSQPVASPLDGRVARCPRCASFTYDVAGLSDEEVRRLVLETEGRVLNRLVLRTDGRSMSVDCGHGTVRPRSARRGLVVGALVAIALVASALSGVAVLRALKRAPAPTTGLEASPPPVDLAGVVGSPPRHDPALVPTNEAPLDPGLHSTSELPPLALDEPVAVTTTEPSPAALGDVHLAEVSASWSKAEVLPGELVERLESQLEPVRRCYGEALSLNRHYRGTLTTHLSVAKDGTVSHVSMPLRTNKAANARLRQCVEGALKALRFEPRSSASVSFRLIFAGAR